MFIQARRSETSQLLLRLRGTYGHVGIVKSVSGNTYVTIDGNSKDQVRTTNRTVGSPKASFCRPAYGSGSGSSTNLSMGSSGTDVKDMQKSLLH